MDNLAIISGASSGIGQQIAFDLSKAGFKCILFGRDIKKLKATESKCANSECYQLDLQNEEMIEKTTTEILKKFLNTKFKQIVLINNAGIVERESFESASIDSWKRQFQTNLYGPVLLTQKLIPLLRTCQNSKIINISSTLGLKTISETSAYSASKAAMNSWTQSLALELAKDKIQVNAICPGIIETPLQSFFNTQDDNLRSSLDSMQPLGRVGQTVDVSNVVLFLCGPKTSWITGTLIPVDGGILVG